LPFFKEIFLVLLTKKRISNMKSKATLKELALALGVSTSTVSKALSGSPEISEATKQKIKEFAQLKNYKPNSIAKNLKNQKTFTIGVILPNILNPFFAKVFSGIEKFANSKSYNLITCISNESFKKETQMLEMLDNGSVDGIILAIAQETQDKNITSHLDSLIKGGTPLVLFDRIADEIKCDKVIVDDLDSGYNATKYLLHNGNKKIALLSTIANLSVGKLRIDGFRSAFKTENSACNENLVYAKDTQEDFDGNIVSFLLNNRPDAIFATDEHASVSAHKICLQNGWHIPNDIEIIGFADGNWSRRLTPSLSTISQHAPEIGQKAAELLINRIETVKDSESITYYETAVIKTELRKRDSVKKL
jgi:LacI family transcriptional regulator